MKHTVQPITCTLLYASFLSRLSWVPETLGKTMSATFTLIGDSEFNFYPSNCERLLYRAVKQLLCKKIIRKK